MRAFSEGLTGPAVSGYNMEPRGFVRGVGCHPCIGAIGRPMGSGGIRLLGGCCIWGVRMVAIR